METPHIGPSRGRKLDRGSWTGIVPYPETSRIEGRSIAWISGAHINDWKDSGGVVPLDGSLGLTFYRKQLL